MRNPCGIVGSSCFVAGTPVRVPGGFKAIEELKVGDRILSRPEDNPYAEVRESVVEKVFKLSGQTVRLVVGAVAELARVPRSEALLIDRIDSSPGYIIRQDWDVSTIVGFAESEPADSQTIITTGIGNRGWSNRRDPIDRSHRQARIGI